MQHQVVLGGVDALASQDALIEAGKDAIEKNYERPIRVVECEWLVTRDARAIVLMPFPSDCESGCPVCEVGRDQARAHLAEHPDEAVAIGLISFEWANS